MGEQTKGLDFEAQRQAIQAKALEDLGAIRMEDYDDLLGWVRDLHSAAGAVLAAYDNPQMRMVIKEAQTGTADDARRLRALLRFMERRQGVRCGIFEMGVSEAGIHVAWAAPLEADTLPELYEMHARAQDGAWGYADLLTLSFFQAAQKMLPPGTFDEVADEAKRMAEVGIQKAQRDGEEVTP